METFGLHINLQPRKEKIDWEYQSVVLELEDYFGKNKILWTLPFRKNCTESLLRYALKETMKREIKDIRYFLKIVFHRVKQKSKVQ